MKKLWPFLLLLCLDVTAKELELKTKITDVTVFQNGAQVTRKGITSIPAGEHEIIVKDATHLLKKESINVKAEGDFTFLSVRHESVTIDPKTDKTKIPLFSKSEKDIIIRIEDLLVNNSVLKNEEDIVMNLLKVNTASAQINVEQIAKAQEILHVKLIAIRQERVKISREVENLQEKLNSVQQELAALRSTSQSIEHHIVISVKAKAETRGNFAISYVVPNASWFPTYDLRVNNIAEPMVVDYKATVSQQSGEDWENVKLTLSTGDPSKSMIKPKVEPWFLYLNQNYRSPVQQSNYYRYTDNKLSRINGVVFDANTGEPLMAANVIVTGTTIGAITDVDGNFNIVLPDNANRITVNYIGYKSQTITLNNNTINIYLEQDDTQLEEVVVTAYSTPLIDKDGGASGATVTRSDISRAPSRGSRTTAASVNGVYTTSAPPAVEQKENLINTEFAIDDKYTLKSQQKPVTVQIKSVSTPVNYQYYCAPRYDKDVFLTAQMINWEQYDFMQGNANIFFEGTFVGNTLMDTRYLKDTLEISLGRDKSILVDRMKSKEYSKHKMLGGNLNTSRHWDITVRNGKKQKINIIIEDQFPVSTDSRVEIKPGEYGDGKYNEKTGIVTWQFDLNISETRKMILQYVVTHPKNTFVGLD